MSATSLVILVIYMEVLSWLFVFLLESSACMKYLFIQSYFMVMIFFSILWWPDFIVFSVLLKVGLPPFQGWFMHFCSFLLVSSFLFMSTIHKILPLVVLGKKLVSSLLLSYSLLIVSSFFLFQSSLFFFMLVCSSMVHSVWMVLGFLVSKSFSVLYWTIYSVIMITLLSSSFFSKVTMLTTSQGILTMMSWLVVSGIPPFALFWLKANLVLVLINISIFSSFLIIFSSVLTLSIYFWAFHLGMMSSLAFSSKLFWFSPIIILLSFIGMS